MQKSEQRMKAICEYIEEYQFEYHRTPTMDLIAEAVGTVKSNVYKYLGEMEQRGMIDRNGRNIIVHSKVHSSPKLNRVPILGNVSCGALEYAEENFEEYVPLPAALFGEGQFFILRASGNSMIEAGIEPGDLVVVRKQATADDGDTAEYQPSRRISSTATMFSAEPIPIKSTENPDGRWSASTPTRASPAQASKSVMTSTG